MTDIGTHVKWWGLLLGLLLAGQAAAEVKGRVRIALAGESEAWLGQQVQVDLDIESTGFSFADVQFDLPEVAGAIFMQVDTTTVKLSENRNGEAWQIIRYPLVLFPQKAGVVTVPPMAVRFNSTAGFGTEPRRFDLRTESLMLTVRRPPGLLASEPVVSTPEFQLGYRRSPDSAELKTGDALKLQITRTARGVSGMFMQPLVLPELAGVAIYPQSPRITDHVDRGALTGERIDEVTWVFEQAGQYAFPEMDFVWWDPRSEQLKKRVVPAWAVEVTAGPLGAAGVPPVRIERPGFWHLWPVVAVVLLGAMAWVVVRAVRRRAQTVSAANSFDSLVQACHANDASRAYQALSAWAADQYPHSPAWTATTLAGHSGSPEFAAAVQDLQASLVASSKTWRGQRLANALRAVRADLGRGQKTARRYDLPQLNPDR